MNPVYNHFLTRTSWESFNSTPEELRFGPKDVDFSIDQRTWCQTCKKVSLFIFKIILFPWIIYDGISFLLQRILMMNLYPAQSTIVKYCMRPAFKTANLDQVRVEIPASFPGKIIRHVRLEKDGHSYSGLILSTAEKIQNRKWILQATGNLDCFERAAKCMNPYLETDYNVLIVNGPGVGRSDGIATTQNLGKPQEIGISYLEKALGAKEIVMAGFSLGGAAIGEAIMEHEFKNDIDYLAIRQMSFDKVSNVGRKIMEKNGICLAPFSKFLAILGNTETDSTEASKKLIELEIPEAIVHAGSSSSSFDFDGVIPIKATHGARLQKEGITKHKYFYHVPEGKHELPFIQTIQAINDWQIRRREKILIDAV